MRVKPESTIISWKSRASNLIVLVESEIKHKIYIDFKIFLKRNILEDDCLATSLSIEE